jgi:hypothetical protein
MEQSPEWAEKSGQMEPFPAERTEVPHPMQHYTLITGLEWKYYGMFAESWIGLIRRERPVTMLWHSKHFTSVTTIAHATEERCFLCGLHG